MTAEIFDTLAPTIFGVLKEAAQATFNPQVGGSQLIDVIFTERHQDTDANGVPYGEPRPVAWVQIAQVAQAPLAGDQLVISAVVYTVREVRTDGVGAYELTLSDI